MAIKKLQNNFTTPEQSKRLLELGVPADSADCFMQTYSSDITRWHNKYSLSEFVEYANKRYGREYYCYCWSIGRLMEIFQICANIDMTYLIMKNPEKHEPIIDFFVNTTIGYIKAGLLDLSKLEE